MGYYLNNKEVGYAKYIEYLENAVLSAEAFLDEMCDCGLPAAHPEIDEVANNVKENRKD